MLCFTLWGAKEVTYHIKTKDMTTLEFNNQPTKVITEKEAVEFMKTLNMNWFGFNNFTPSDQDRISDQIDVLFEPQDNGTFKLHDLTFDFED